MREGFGKVLLNPFLGPFFGTHILCIILAEKCVNVLSIKKA